jgi:hypothetical protein
MPKQTIDLNSVLKINIGITADDGTGDNLRTAFDKVNSNLDLFGFMLATGYQFRNLTDTPADYVPNAVVTVNSAATGLVHRNLTSSDILVNLTQDRINLQLATVIGNVHTFSDDVTFGKNITVMGNTIVKDTYINVDVFETENTKDVEAKIKNLKDDEFEVSTIASSDTLLCLLSYKKVDNRMQKQVSISFDVFTSIIEADPTPNKSCVQWMLNVFTRLIKSGGTYTQVAIRFVIEDLPQASSYIALFESNKRKKRFKDFCSSSHILKHIVDPTDINQYTSLAQLFDAVDPFIERKPSEVESMMDRFVKLGQAEIPVRDRKFTLFIPKVRDANVIFDKFANWCTAKPENGMFRSYTENNRRPNGNKSSIYIIINNKFLFAPSSTIWVKLSSLNSNNTFHNPDPN